MFAERASELQFSERVRLRWWICFIFMVACPVSVLSPFLVSQCHLAVSPSVVNLDLAEESASWDLQNHPEKVANCQ